MNLIIASTLGGLHRAQNLVAQENLKNNVLGILFTTANLEVPRNLLENVIDGFFDAVEMIEISKSTQEVRLNKAKVDYATYKGIFDKYPLSKVFINSFDFHYNHINTLARERNIPVALYEEGTGTYNFLTGHSKFVEPNFTERMKSATWPLKKLLSRYKNLLLIQTFVVIIKTTKQVLFGLFTVSFKKKIRSYFYPKHLRAAFGQIKAYDEIYVVFPEMGEKIFTANSYRKLNLAYHLRDDLVDKIDTQPFSEDDVIFVDQVFSVPVKIHLQAVFSYLDKRYPEKNIYLKLHPKLREKTKLEYEEWLSKEKPNARLLETGTSDLPLEVILQLKSAKHLVGLTSTTLVNAKELIPEITVFSFMSYYIDFVSKYAFIPKASIDNLYYHKAHLEIYQTIEIV